MIDRTKRRLSATAAVALGGLLVFAALRLAGRWPWLVEHAYARRIGAWIGRALSTVSGIVPLSLAEALVLGALVTLVTAGLYAAARRLRGLVRIETTGPDSRAASSAARPPAQQDASSGAASSGTSRGASSSRSGRQPPGGRARAGPHSRGANRGAGAETTLPLARRMVNHLRGVLSALHQPAWQLVAIAALVLASFELLWGLHYARPDLVARQGWSPVAAIAADDAVALDELEALAAQLVEATNDSYRAAHGRTDLGRPSRLPAPARTMDRALERGYARAAAVLGWPASLVAPRAPAKPLVGSRLLSHMGVVGFYFPWTGEANYNRETPHPQLPHGIAHEKAHQRGVASEDEASFVGYVAAVASDDAYARYSGYLYAQRRLLTELLARDQERAIALLEARHRGVQRDVDAARAFWAQFDGPARSTHRRVNDTYLRANGIEEGVASYSRSAELLVAFARANGGRVVLGPATGGDSDVTDAAGRRPIMMRTWDSVLSPE